MLPVPTHLEDIEIGDEVGLAGFIWNVCATTTEIVHGESGAARTVFCLICRPVNVDEVHNARDRSLLRGWDGTQLRHTGERLDVVARWVPLADIVEAFQWDVSDPENRNCAAAVVPALVNRVRELEKRADSAETRLHESRRMRTLAEEITGSRGGE